MKRVYFILTAVSMQNSSIQRKTVQGLVRAFPVPKYLAMPAVGLDISDYAIKYISLTNKKGRRNLETYGKIDLPLEVIERGEIKDMETVVKLLTRLRDEYNFNFAHLALPEEHAYLFQMSVPKGTRTEVEQKIEFHLKENVPIEANEAVFDFSIYRKHKDTYDVNVSVYPQGIVMQYMSALEEAGFTLLSLEIEGQATARTLLGGENDRPVLVVDIGRNNSSVSISTQGEVTFTASLDVGGDHFTRAIARDLNISFQEAEKLKRKYGLRDTEESEMVFNSFEPVIANFAQSIQKHIMYWHMHMNSTGTEEEEVSRVIVVGGNANIAGLVEYLEAVLELSVEVGDVWKRVFFYDEYVPDMHASNSLEYATAVGLGLRSLSRSE